MTLRAALSGMLAGSIVLAAGAAFAQSAPVSVPVRAGAHAGYSRVVLDLPVPTQPGVERSPGELKLRLAPNQLADVAAIAARPPPFVLGITAAPGEVTLRLAPGAELRSFRLGNRLVLDVLEPPATATPAAAPTPPAAPPPAAPTAAAGTARATPSTPPPTPASPQPPAPTPPSAQPAPAPPPAAPGLRERAAALPLPVPPVPPGAPEVLARLAALPAPTPPSPSSPPSAEAAPSAAPVDAPVAVAALPSPPNNFSIEEATPRPPPQQGPVSLIVRAVGENAILLPFDTRVGIAIFRRGPIGWIVLDEPRPLDLAALRNHPKFGSAEITVAAAATVLRVKLEPGQGLSARRETHAWIVELADELVPTRPLRANVAGEVPRLALPTGNVGRSTALRDPATGETLLVGTVRDAAFGLAPARAYPAFALPATVSGLLVVPQADTVGLRALTDGFVIAANLAGSMGLPLANVAEGAVAAAARLTRTFDLAGASEAALADRVRRLAAEAGNVPPLARFRFRIEAAEALVALGMGLEAQGVLALAMAEDPAAARDPRAVGLAAVAALLAGRMEDTRGLADPRLNGSDEIAMWRGIRAIAQGQPPAAQAPVFAATAPLVATYAPALRRRLAPLLADGMAAGGEPDAAERLLAAAEPPAEQALLARGRIAEARGQTDAALEAYEEATRSRDRMQRAQALVAGTELALASGRIDAAGAAKRLDGALYAWRGDGFEISQRERVAELRMQAGDPRGALGLLRETASLFPEHEPRVRPKLAGAFASMFRAGPDGTAGADALPPAQAVTMFEENVDLLPAGPEGEAMIARLAERLLQLDLPGRAAALVARVMEAQPEGEARAATGARLAAMRLADKDPLGARAALAASAADDLPPSLVRERRTLEARALAESGDAAAALAALGSQSDPPALELRAAIAAAAGDWNAAVPPLAALAASTLPPPGSPLAPDERRTLLRLATAAALSGQSELLASIARERGDAMRDGPHSEAFRLLTGDPVRGAADLPRIASELQLARGLPQALAAATPRR